jgi:hypothetical protein
MNKEIQEYKNQMQIGTIPKAYKVLIEYMMKLKKLLLINIHRYLLFVIIIKVIWT